MVRTLARHFVIWMVCLSFGACTTMRVVAQGQEAARNVAQEAASPDPRDWLLIVTKDGQRREVQVTAVDAGDIVGIESARKESVRIPADQVERIERRELDGVKTLLLVGAIALVTALLAHGIANKAADLASH